MFAEGNRGQRGGAVQSWYRLGAECHSEKDRHRNTESAQQGRPGSILGPVTLGWWASQHGVLSRVGEARVPWRLPGPVQDPGRCWQWHLGSAHIIQGLVGHEGAQQGAQGMKGKDSCQGAWVPHCPAGPSPCGQTQVAQRPSGAHQNCSTSAASVQPVSASGAARAPGSWFSEARESRASGARARSTSAPTPGAGGPQLTGFLLHSMKPIWPLG